MIVEDAAVIVREKAVPLLAGLQCLEIGRAKALKGRGGSRKGLCTNAYLAHMRDVKQAGCGPGVKVFGQNSGWILHRHVVASEGHHLGTQSDMKIM